MRRAWALAALIGLLGTVCGKGGGSRAIPTPSASTVPSGPSASAPTPTGSPPTKLDLTKVHIKLVQVASLDAPLAMAVRSGDDSLYFAEKGGRVVALRGGGAEPETVLDLSGEVSDGSEQGLLGLAFSPDGAFMYVNYTDPNGDTQVVEFGFDQDGVTDGSRRTVLSVDQPFPNHNGGNLVFGPDGYLYIGLGDGGSQGDPNHNGQNLGVLLAKMLRIDPRAAGGAPYSIPPNNPFVGDKSARPEIWAYGLRNPWRYSFDRETGDLWIGDVGGAEREEVDFQPAGQGGQNYGWNLLEGTVPHTDNLPLGAVPPIHEYDHSGGRCVVTGGYVYRGSAIPALRGGYLFADYCAGDIIALAQKGGHRTQIVKLGRSVPSLASFGEDQAGELYALSLSGPVYRIDPA
jgi:glucose/arabinose dehydrogenase